MRIKYLAIACAATLLAATGAFGAERFITDKLEITLRSGAGTDYRILRSLSAGTPIEVFEEKEGWSRISAGAGKEGWIITRYTTETPPAAPRLAAAKGRIKTLTGENKKLSKSLKKITREADSLAGNNRSYKKKLSKVEKAFAKWKKTNAGVMLLKDEHAALSVTTKNQSEEIASLTMENRQLNARRYVYWGLSGALIIACGYIAGTLFGGSKRSAGSGRITF